MADTTKPAPRISVNVPLNQIKVDPSLQMRAAGLNRDWVLELARLRKNGVEFRDPVILFQPKKGKYLLAGGFHRYEAEKLCGNASIRAVVLDGEYRDAWLFALGDNYAHGQRRTREDLRKAATEALNDPELCQMSAREIAGIVKCDPGWVARLKREITGAAPDPSKQRTGGGKKSPSVPPPAEDGGDDTPGGTTTILGTDFGEDRGHDKDDEPPVVRDEMGRLVPEPIADDFAADPHAHCVCPLYDYPAEDVHDSDCETCGGKGYLTSEEFRALPQVVKDQSLGVPDPVERALAFRGEFDEAAAMVRRLARMLNRLATTPGGYFLRNCHDRDGTAYLQPVSAKGGDSRYTFPALTRLLSLLTNAAPKCRCVAKADPHASHGDCPYCAGQGWAPVAGGLIGTRPESLQLELHAVDPWESDS